MAGGVPDRVRAVPTGHGRTATPHIDHTHAVTVLIGDVDDQSGRRVGPCFHRGGIDHFEGHRFRQSLFQQDRRVGLLRLGDRVCTRTTQTDLSSLNPAHMRSLEGNDAKGLGLQLCQAFREGRLQVAIRVVLAYEQIV
jgi:hypothetical protein